MHKDASFQFILDLLNQEKFLTNQKDTFLQKLRNLFDDFDPSSSLFIDELILLLENEPQIIVSLTKEFLTSRELLSRIFEISNTEIDREEKKKTALPDQMKAIAERFELSGLFYLTAYLLSRRKLQPGAINSPMSVLAQLKPLGLTGTDIETLRHIRNASSHKYSFDGENIVWNNTKIAFAKIEELNILHNKIMSWNMTLIFYAFWFIPKFGILIAATVYSHIKNNGDDWTAYMKGVSIFFKSSIQAAENENNKNKKPVESEMVPILLPDDAKTFLLSNLSTISERWNFHMNSMADTVSEIHDKIADAEVKQTLQRLTIWLRQGGDIIEFIINEYNKNPLKYSASITINGETTMIKPVDSES